MHVFDPFDGALLVDKPVGPTSHDVVDLVRRHFNIKKVGHCGTLDPNATGLLILVLGRATKLSERLMADDKAYSGSIRFGVITDSHDADGQILETRLVLPLTLAELNQTAASFVGDQMQVPPMVSAVKQGGVPLYKLARKGMEVERKPRLIHIYTLQFSEYTEPVGYFQITCTKGTYVRSIAHDLGEKLGCGAHLSELRRLRSGRFGVEQAITCDQLRKFDRTQLQPHIIPFIQLT